MEYTREKDNGITLIVLIVTIVILLVLAAITITTLGGENGIIAKAKQAQKVQEIAEAQEELRELITNVKTQKGGYATLTDVVEALKADERYTYIVKFDQTANLSSKGDVTGTSDIPTVTVDISEIFVTHKECEFKVDQELIVEYVGENIVDLDDSIEMSYEVKSREGNNVNILIKVIDKQNGIKQIEYPNNENIVYCNGRNNLAIDYTVELGKEYKFKITPMNGQIKEDIIKIDDYWYYVAKTLDEGASINNQATRAAYNKPYEATVTANDGYEINTITVKMGSQTIITSGDNIVDNTTGQIKIANVTDNIEIIVTVTARKLEIETTDPYIGTSNTETDSSKSVAGNSQTKGKTTLYINFNATLEGIDCTIEPTVPYAVTSNGQYKFIASGTYNGKTITKEIEVKVDKYETALDLVQYNAGDWTVEEINSLKTDKLYDINASHSINSTFKLNDNSGLNFTFGGFTYKGDISNQTAINSGTVITSRNQSVSSESGSGTPKYDGWQVLESKEENGKKYVTKLVHAGAPENFVLYYTKEYDPHRAEYLVSNGLRQIGYSKLSDGTTVINPRSWQEYIDQTQKDLIADTTDKDGKNIKDIHAMTYSEAIAASSTIRVTGSNYWLGSAERFGLDYIDHYDSLRCYGYACYGVRPVVSLKSGVYIVSGDGTEASPYILAKE